jgi:hypothetical protein
VVRRRLTLKRIDPWSVLKFGFVANIVLLAVFLLVAAVVWFIIDRLALVDQACAIATDVGFTQCGVNFGNLFRALILLGLLWVVVQTAVLVFLSFLYNLIADLTGGLTVTMYDSTPGAAARGEAGTRPAGVVGATGTGPTSGAFTSRSPTEGGATPRPPVAPLRRDPGQRETRAEADRPVPDPDAPPSRTRSDVRPEARPDETAEQQEPMFGDRNRRDQR